MEQEAFRMTIAGHPATKKNSSRAFHGIVLPSKAYKAYESRFHRQMMDMRKSVELPHYDCPIHIVVCYWLKNAAHWPDLLGLEQATADILSDQYKTVNHKRQLSREWILSDDRIIKSWDGSQIAGIDKDNPRCEIEIIPLPFRRNEPDPYLKKRMASLFTSKSF